MMFWIWKKNSCSSSLCPKQISILLNIEFKILRKRSGDKASRISFKVPRRGWDQRLADFNRFSSVEARSCFSCLVLYLHALCQSSVHFFPEMQEKFPYARVFNIPFVKDKKSSIMLGFWLFNFWIKREVPLCQGSVYFFPEIQEKFSYARVFNIPELWVIMSFQYYCFPKI